MNIENCSFCGRPLHQARLVQGDKVAICEHCIKHAHTALSEGKQGVSESVKNADTDIANIELPTPQKIKSHLDEYIIGQDDAKKYLSVAVYNHYKRIKQNQSSKDDVELEKSNVILVGETGTGKTLLARTIARMLKVPFAIVDATVLTEAGYVGEDVETILTRLLQVADYNTKVAEKGIVFIDEIDKISRKSDNPSITRDVSGEGVQQGLLKLLEGSIINVPPQGGRKHPDQKMIPVNTKDILFIAGGAFEGIQKLIARRVNTNVIGYSSKKHNKIDENNLLRYITPSDLRAYGLIPEILGRLPVLTHLEVLGKDALRRILTEPKNAIVKQYTRLFEMDGVKLSIDDDALDYIVEKALEHHLGARGLRSICEEVMIDAMFDFPEQNQNTLHITKLYAQEKLSRNFDSKMTYA
ncbi:MAG: ATP-dependent Clp protease ATP-binding subunit ClpX [Bacteroidales bacterium]